MSNYKYLDKVNFPSDIKKLSIDELNISNKKYDDPNAANNINRYPHLAAFFPNVTTRWFFPVLASLLASGNWLIYRIFVVNKPKGIPKYITF